MQRNRLLRMQIRAFILDGLDRLRDLFNCFWPIFVVSGMLVGSVAFWMRVFGL